MRWKMRRRNTEGQPEVSAPFIVAGASWVGGTRVRKDRGVDPRPMIACISESGLVWEGRCWKQRCGAALVGGQGWRLGESCVCSGNF